MDSHGIIKLFWHCQPDEDIVSLCNFRDQIIIATTRRLYILVYDYASDQFIVDETKKE